MTWSLVTVNMALDVVLKVLFLAVLVYVFMLLRNIDELVRSAERSAESIERTADQVGKLIRISRYLPLVGRKKDE